MPTTETPTTPRKKKPTIHELAAQGVRDSLARPVGMPGLEVSTVTQPGVRSKLQLDRSTGLLPLVHVRPDPDQPRRVNTRAESFRDLVASVKAHGVLEPITVRYVADGDYFQIIAGERRYQAALAAGLKDIRAIVHDVDDTEKAIHQLVENLHREDLNPIEEAAAFRRYLAATNQTQDQLAARIGKSKTYVSRILAIEEQLTIPEKRQLAKVAPAQLPGKSLIYEALQAPRPEIRRAILFGELNRVEARKAIAEAKAKPVGRPKTFARAFRAEEIGATVTVRFDKKKNASREDVLDALDDARAQLKRELRS